MVLKSKYARRSTKKWVNASKMSAQQARNRYFYFREKLLHAKRKFDKQEFYHVLDALDAPGTMPDIQRKKLLLRGWREFFKATDVLRGPDWFNFVTRLGPNPFIYREYITSGEPFYESQIDFLALLNRTKSLPLIQKRALRQKFLQDAFANGILIKSPTILDKLINRYAARKLKPLFPSFKKRLASDYDLRLFVSRLPKSKNNFVDRLSIPDSLATKYRKELARLKIHPNDLWNWWQKADNAIANAERKMGIPTPWMVTRSVPERVEQMNEIIDGLVSFDKTFQSQNLPEGFKKEINSKIVPAAEYAFALYSDLVKNWFVSAKGPQELRRSLNEKSRVESAKRYVLDYRKNPKGDDDFFLKMGELKMPPFAERVKEARALLREQGKTRPLEYEQARTTKLLEFKKYFEDSLAQFPGISEDRRKELKNRFLKNLKKG